MGRPTKVDITDKLIASLAEGLDMLRGKIPMGVVHPARTASEQPVAGPGGQELPRCGQGQ